MKGEHSILIDAITYLSAAVICIPVASRLKFGSVLGYLSAGALIGPFGLALVDDPVSTMHFAEFGVVLMLFLIGLELDPKHLWTMRRAVFRGGSLQLLASAGALCLGLLALGLPWQGALVGGAALSLSSTAVAMQTMAERNLTQTTLGRSAFGILLFQDIAAIPLVALVPLLAEGSDAGSTSYEAALAAVAAIIATVVLGRTLVPRLLRVVAGTGLREVFTAFTLLLVLGVAQLMASVGVSMALGAFLAGVLLAGSEYRHALETDIEPFKGLLMGLFFMAVGMSVDFGLFARSPLLLCALVVGFTALKLVALHLVSSRLGLAKGEPFLFAALLAQGGEFAFVVFGIARAANVIPSDWEK
ncbi:MAG TPA: monovalent cation:proton antiporter-2 (CPA2) family protein, partial [Polyangiaceae bacterium]|nr:monovalent cation:proton antiporter-2 (CPA2) family protein [Polyangiaceae bacterium]